MNVKEALLTLQDVWRPLEGLVTGLYVFGSLARGRHAPGLSDVNTLALLREETPPRRLREAFRPLWPELRPALARPPLLAGPEAWARLPVINPALFAAIVGPGRPIWGAPLPAAQETPARQILAWEAWSAWQASAALTAAVLAPETAHGLEIGLRRLARRHGLDLAGEPGELLAGVQERLGAAIPARETPPPARSDAPPLLPELAAIYSLGDDFVFIFPDGRPDVWTGTDWSAVAASVEGECDRIFLTTIAQVGLVVPEMLAVELTLGNLDLVWGEAVLEGLKITPPEVWRGAAAVAGSAALDSLPAAYLTVPEDELGDLIHGFQNRLLNLQLRQEILFRLGHSPDWEPEEPLPDRSVEPHERVAAIFRQFHGWANHYAGLMAAA